MQSKCHDCCTLLTPDGLWLGLGLGLVLVLVLELGLELGVARQTGHIWSFSWNYCPRLSITKSVLCWRQLWRRRQLLRG